MREALQELYGIEGSLIEQYFVYWGRILRPRFRTRRFRRFRRRFRTLIGARAALDDRPAVHLHAARLGARQPARRARRLLPQEPDAEAARRDRDGLSSDPLLHHRLRPADHLRLSVAGASDQRRLRRRTSRRPSPSTTSAACIRHSILPALLHHPRRHRRLVPRHAGAGLQHRHRGLRRLCRARRRAAAAASFRSTSCATR